ncbi:MAG: tRNA (adenosine(37)-N6)-threonylcarbamoyltransferase complex ATPase subunit type 1 TsaE [Ferruginibacter sp.]
MDSIFTYTEIDKTAEWFLQNTDGKKLFAFHGDMGTGKTTFINAICKQMHVEDPVSSPTYSIINEYYTPDGVRVFHLDLYRIKSEQEAIDAGVEECFYSNDYCFVEWPDKTPSLFPPGTVHVYLESMDDKTRKLKINL